MNYALTLACAAWLAQAPAAGPPSTTVGMPLRLHELVLPGPELEVAPIEGQTPLVLRITSVSPHGDAFRYDLEAYGLDPGEYDLGRFLQRKDGTPAAGLPALPLHVSSLLPPGQVLPHAPPAGEAPGVGGYTTWLVVGALAWTLGLVLLLFAGRKKHAAAQAAHARPLTLAERLRPLVEAAMQNRLSRTERAQLELGLVAYWRRKLGFEEERPETALVRLRQDAQAGPLLQALEDWLHRPVPPADVDLARLLAPYKDLPPDAIELGPRAGGAR